MKLYKFLFPLFIVAFLAGCTQFPGISGGTTGVVIKTFSFIPTSPVEPSTPVYLSLDVENTGGARATGVSAEIIGINDWTFDPKEPRTQSIIDLDYPDPSRGINQGGTDHIEWTIKPPEKTVQIPYDIGVRVKYSYKSTFEGRVGAVTNQYYRQTSKKTGVIFSKASSGPLSIKLTAPNSIISAGRIPVIFEVKNVGGGGILNDELTFSISGANCPKTTVKMIKGQSAILYCNIDTSGVANYAEFSVSLSTSYQYYVDSSTSITVLPKPPV